MATRHKSESDDYSKQEARQRFEAALRGARVVGHKPMSEMKVGKPKPTATMKRRAKRKKPS